jgi:hypothetical protein
MCFHALKYNPLVATTIQLPLFLHMQLQIPCTKVAECLSRSYYAEFRVRLPLLAPSAIYGTECMHLGDDEA